MNPELPFKPHGGKDQQAAIHNRIAAIQRIEYLSGVSLKNKSATYLQALDLEMWQRWYKDAPAKKQIDEEFCQRASEVIKAMEGKPDNFDKDKYYQAKADHLAKMENENNADKQPESDSEVSGAENKPVKD